VRELKKITQFLKMSATGLWLFFRYGPAKVSEWKNQSIYDDLTGLYNRRFFQEIGRKELLRAVRYNYPFSVIQIDLDKFKLINDEEGHVAGDEALKKVATLLQNACRESDIIARTGGDEFTILLPEATKEDAEKVIIERIKELSKSLTSPGGKAIELSCGVASWEERFSLEALRKEADAEMYQDKKSRGD
jgi:diguanylate cyclase (GGDEF)-like protein